MTKRAATKPTEASKVLVKKGLPCPVCGGSRAALYEDGHMFCFSNCDRVVVRSGGDQTAHPTAPPRSGPSVDYEQFLSTGKVRKIDSRAISLKSATFWNYLTRENPSNGDLEHLTAYRDNHGNVTGVKVRVVHKEGTPKEEVCKDFYWVGKAEAHLYGRHLWSAGSGRMVTVCEGEIDTVTVSQEFDHKWPVVGVPNGAGEAHKAVAANLEFLSSFDRVVFAFDMDQPGREAAEECAKLMPPGKAFIAKFSQKDPNALKLAGLGEEITRAIHFSEAYRPDGIVDARELTDACLDNPVVGIPWPHKFMTKWTYGRRPGEVITFGSGTGMGKSDFLAEVIASTISGETRDGHATYTPEGFAVFAYEAGAATIKKQIAGKLAGRRFHIPHPDPEDPEGEDPGWTQEELRACLARMDNELWTAGGKLFINDSKGASDWESLMERARFLKHSEGIRHFLVDPLGALAATAEDERKFLDKLVIEAANLSVELEATIYLVSHLTRPDQGPSHEEGGHVQLKQFRGSNGIGMFSNFVIGLERNQQADTEQERATSTFRVVKDRFTGNSVGKTAKTHYDAFRGTLDTPAEDTQAFLTDKSPLKPLVALPDV